MLHCFSRRAKLLKATATNYKHACTCKHSSQPLSTPWSRSKLSLPKLKASLVACFRHLLAENFFPRFRKLRRSQKTSVANQNGQQPTKYFSAQRKLPRTVENFEKQLGSRGYSHRTTSAAQMLTFSHPLSMGISSFPAHHHRCMSK